MHTKRNRAARGRTHPFDRIVKSRSVGQDACACHDTGVKSPEDAFISRNIAPKVIGVDDESFLLTSHV